MPQIRAMTGAQEGQIYPLTDQNFLIGRDPASCHIVLDAKSSASRQHASVYPALGQWHIRDLGSLNGTIVNGQRIEDQPLRDGDRIVLADTEFRYEDEDAPADASADDAAGEEAAAIDADSVAALAAPVASPAPAPAPAPAKARPAAAAPAALTAEQTQIQEVVRHMSKKTKLVENEIGKVIVGQRTIIVDLLTAIISGGHVLMVGLPGLAKTLMIRTVSEVLDLNFRRIQFTPDLMPSDITGTDVLEVDETTGRKDYRFLRGPIFTNILLADEINRTPPKTQAALLEAMQEHRVTAAGETHRLDPPFFVLATQNPLEQEGTYPLPEAQLDRFMFSVYVDYPEEAEEETIAKVTTSNRKISLERVLTGAEILELQDVVRNLPISDHVVKFATRLVRATRPTDARAPDFIKKWVHCGAGPRASQYLVLAAKARAVIEGRLLVTTDDVRGAARLVLRHRIFTNFAADSEGVDGDKIVQKLLSAVSEPGEKDY